MWLQKVSNPKDNLLNYLNKIILLLCYMFFFGKIKNVLHLLWMGTKNFTPITIYMGFEHKTCKKIETCLTIWGTYTTCLNVHLSIFIYLPAQHHSRPGSFTRLGHSRTRRGKMTKKEISRNWTLILGVENNMPYHCASCSSVTEHDSISLLLAGVAQH